MSVRAVLRSPWRAALAGALLLLLLNAASYLLLTRPRQERSRRVAELTAKTEQALARERSEVERLRQRARLIEVNRREAKQFFSRTVQPQDQGLAADLEALEEAFRRAGVAAERRSYKREDVRDLPLVRLDHQVTVSGSRERLATLLDQIERSPRFIVISGIRLRQEEQGAAKLEARLATYYRDETKDVPKGTAKVPPRTSAPASR